MNEVVVSSTFAAPAETVFDMLRQTETIRKLNSGFPITYDAPVLPERWEVDKKINLRPRFLGIPQGDHIVKFTIIDREHLFLCTEESSASITQWDHRMELKPLPNGQCQYTDTVTIKAGWRTVLVKWVARKMYQNRHKQLHKLVKG